MTAFITRYLNEHPLDVVPTSSSSSEVQQDVTQRSHLVHRFPDLTVQPHDPEGDVHVHVGFVQRRVGLIHVAMGETTGQPKEKFTREQLLEWLQPSMVRKRPYAGITYRQAQPSPPPPPPQPTYSYQPSVPPPVPVILPTPPPPQPPPQPPPPLSRPPLPPPMTSVPPLPPPIPPQPPVAPPVIDSSKILLKVKMPPRIPVALPPGPPPPSSRPPALPPGAFPPLPAGPPPTHQPQPAADSDSDSVAMSDIDMNDDDDGIDFDEDRAVATLRTLLDKKVTGLMRMKWPKSLNPIVKYNKNKLGLPNGNPFITAAPLPMTTTSDSSTEEIRDLTTLQKRVRVGKYLSVEAFEHDAKLFASYIMAVNGQIPNLSDMARVMNSEVDAVIKSLRPWRKSAVMDDDL